MFFTIKFSRGWKGSSRWLLPKREVSEQAAERFGTNERRSPASKIDLPRIILTTPRTLRGDCSVI